MESKQAKIMPYEEYEKFMKNIRGLYRAFFALGVAYAALTCALIYEVLK